VERSSTVPLMVPQTQLNALSFRAVHNRAKRGENERETCFPSMPPPGIVAPLPLPVS
jgi:hypothetical protein